MNIPKTLNKMTTDTPRTDAYQYADYILNHYDRGSHDDKLCLAKSLIEHGWEHADKLQKELKASQAEVERLKGIKQIKVSKRPYDYECGDGCCSEYGETWSVDGVEVAHGPCDDNRLQQLLKHLGYNARIVNENEDGEEICEL